MIHLDTGFLIRALVPASAEDHRLRLWIEDNESIGMTAVAWTEFLCGPVDAGTVQLAGSIIAARADYGEPEAHLAAELFSSADRRRRSLTDCMIAAAAIVAGAALATTNAADFRRFEAQGLVLAEV